MTRAWLLMLGSFATVAFATILLAIVPEVALVEAPAPEGLEPYTASESRGRQVYIREGCIYCHTQQIRDPSFTTDVERGWGTRASVPGDYVYDSPHLLGTMRTGPDLTNVGARLPSRAWHLLHLYNPRAVVEWSIMPAFPYLFEAKDSSDVASDEVVVPVGAPHAPAGKVIVATPDALALVDYLLSLDRTYPVEPPAGGHAAGAGRSAHTMP
ncbi:MAG TPA: cbb3-type cytochrome c oxidase subunit II [Longimicrobiales bacterium]